MWSAQRIGGVNMNSLSLTERTCANEGIQVDDIRALIAKHLHVDVERVTDEAHFSDDLHADWLNRLELLILIEDRFADVEFPDGNSDKIETVGDLIRYVQDVLVGSMTGRRRAFAT
jgi:acyl carrier protein